MSELFEFLPVSKEDMESRGWWWYDFLIVTGDAYVDHPSFGPTVIVILGSCVFRVIWVYTIFAHFHTIASLYLLYIFSWVLTAVAEIAFFIIGYKKTVLAVG